MKTQSIIKSALFTIGFSAMALIGAKAQVTVDAQFLGGGAAYTGTGAASDPGTFWNGIALGGGGSGPFTGTDLKASDGVTGTTISATLTDDNFIHAQDFDGLSSPQANLMGQGSYSSFNSASSLPGTFTLALAGLNSGDTYDLFLYGQSGSFNNAITIYTINGVSLTANNPANSGDLTGLVNGGNYVEFTGLTGSAALSIDLGGQPANAYMNGFQLVDTTAPVEAPEPSTYALMGLGALALLVVSRRRRTV